MYNYKGKRKYLAAVIAAAITLSPAAAVKSYAEVPEIIHQTNNKQTITKGVTHENIVKFTTAGWYNIHVLEVDLSNKYIDIDTLTNTESVSKLASTKKMAEQRKAIAAINASFYTPSGGGYGYPVGTVVQSSEILAASNDVNRYSDSMASFTLTELKEALFDYWKMAMCLVSENGNKVDVLQYNKRNKSNFADLTVLDRKWGEAAVGATEEMPDIMQMVVEDGKVTQFLTSQPAAMIPENGFVAVARGNAAQSLMDAFSIGESVALNIQSTPDSSGIKMSVSGSSILVQEGKIPEKFSFSPADVVKASPKTAIGSSKDGRYLYFVTVDGRQTASIGLTLSDMAQLMKDIGAFNAVSMDGGGSTTMVARPMADTQLKIMNNPSDGIARGVSTALGIFTTAPAAPLAGMVIKTTDRYMFTHTTREFAVKGYDSYNNPVDVDPELVKWSISGVKGKFEGNVFRPSTYGEGKITAQVGKIKASLDISVLSKPIALSLSDTTIKLPVGNSKTFSIIGTNPRGYKASIAPKDLKWSVNGDIGTFTDGVFSATAKGSGYIEASFDDIQAYCGVSVSSVTTSIFDKFESKNGSFLSYPDTVKGSYSISKEQKVSGKASGKLTYDFIEADYSRAAYMVLPDEGLLLEEGMSKIGLNVNNDHENSGWLRAELIDANGKKQMVDLAKTMDWIGWKYVEAPIDNISHPVRLTRIYIVQTNPIADAGVLYFDDLTITENGYPAIDESKLPADTEFADESYKEVRIPKVTDENFRFAVMGQSRKPENDVEESLVNKFGDKVTKYLELGGFVGSGSHESVTSLIKNTPVVATHTVDLKSTKEQDYKYSYTDLKNSRFFKLDTRQNSLRLSDSMQWKQFMSDLEAFEGKNVFIFMENSPETFRDKLELKLFKDTISRYRLNTLRNVWVFFKGDENTSYMENGVKYISTSGYEVPGVTKDDNKAAQYVLVTVKGSAVTYVFKPIDS